MNLLIITLALTFTGFYSFQRALKCTASSGGPLPMYNLESKAQHPFLACSSMLAEKLPKEHKNEYSEFKIERKNETGYSFQPWL